MVNPMLAMRMAPEGSGTGVKLFARTSMLTAAPTSCASTIDDEKLLPPYRPLLAASSAAWLKLVKLRGIFHTFACCIGLEHSHLPDMEEIAKLAQPYYDVELRVGEGHMEVGKLIQSVKNRKAHMVVSVKPFGCMPSSGVSDGIQSAVLSRLSDAIFCPVETTGDGAVNFQSRVLMYLFRARRKARDEFDNALRQRGISLEEVPRRMSRSQKLATHYAKHVK
jgi:hypothetical protein